ncbi:MAG TPA: hypothetical protein VGF84_22350 [Micromonosporaceae bacterium]|jgi:pyrimidine deaminase RibD-like protein
MSQPSGDHFQISVGGAVGGNLVVGNSNQVIGSPTTNYARPTAAELAAFSEAVNAVKTQAAAHGPEAAAQLDALHAAVTAPTPDLSTMQRVRNWFVEHLPTMAGAVTGLLIHPVVGAVVRSAGEAVTAEFHRRFGSAESPE